MRVVIARTVDVQRGLPDPTSRIDAVTLDRIDALRRPVDRADSLAARALLFSLLPANAETRHRCPRCGGPHGRPLVADRPDLFLSLSHANGWVGAAVAPSPVGLDLEPTIANARLPEASALTRSERDWLTTQPDRTVAFLQLWTRKEALVKAGFPGLDAGLDAGPDAGLDAALGLDVTEAPLGWTFSDHSTDEVVATGVHRSGRHASPDSPSPRTA